jgi:hypothetical protein
MAGSDDLRSILPNIETHTKDQRAGVHDQKTLPDGLSRRLNVISKYHPNG